MNNQNLCILQNFNAKNLESSPFPYLVIENCLPNDIYDEIFEDYQKVIYFLKQENKFEELNNVRLQLNAKVILKEHLFRHTLLYKFVQYHTSIDFFKKVNEIFSVHIKNFYPVISREAIKYSDRDFLAIRDIQNNINKNYKFVIDCQPGINTPILKKSTVRGPHVDNPVELIGGLFYLRDEKDIVNGGDLEIYDTKSNEIYFYKKAEVENTKQLNKIRTIPYKKNTCIFFLNSEKSIHGVSEREKASYTRNLISFLIETYHYKKLFEINRRGQGKINFLKKLFNINT